MAWRLRVLGQASLEGQGRQLVPERKTAALLAYVAIEGQVTRSRIAGLLWPDSTEDRARGNLRQLLRRLRTGAGEDVLDGGDVLRLLPEVEVDVVELNTAAVTREFASGAALAGDLLAGHDFDDCPELLDWLVAQHERLLTLRRDLLSHQIERLADAGDHEDAVRLAERLIGIDPHSEESYRKLMRLHYLAGDRAAALQVYARCKETLVREFDLEPSGETIELAHELEREAAPATLRGRRRAHLSLERPPLLVGREVEWDHLSDAWQEGLPTVIRGEPGMGKSRLAVDFAASHGPYLRLAARPGDASIPYALFTRGLRSLLSRSEDLLPGGWVRQELDRLLPERTPAGTSDPEGDGEDRTRLLAALCEQLAILGTAGFEAVIIDDLQYADDASFDAVVHLLGQELGRGPKWLLCYRRGELAAERESRLVEALGEEFQFVEPGPWTGDDVRALLGSLPITVDEELASPLAQYAGGNPLYVVETLKSLVESGVADRAFPKRLQPPRKLSAIIEARLARLSPGALRLARAVAVLADSFDLEAAGQLLGGEALDLAEPYAELEGSGLVGEAGFTHDLILEAVLAGTPVAVRRLLHGRTARYLEDKPVSAAIKARHYLEAGDELKAAPHLNAAAVSAAAAYRLSDAEDFYWQAAQLFERHGKLDAAFDAMNAAGSLLLKSEFGPRHGELERALFRLARTPAQVATAWQTRAIFLQLVPKAQESEAAAREGHRFAVAAGEPSLQMDLLNNLVGALWLQDRIDETVDILEQAIRLGEGLGDPLRLSEGLANMGVILDHLNRHREAIEYHERAAELRASHGGRLGQVQVLSNLSVSQAELGLMRDSLETSRKMLLLLDEVHGAEDLVVHAHLGAGAALRDLGEFGLAQEQLERACEVAQGLNTWLVAPVKRHLALNYAFVGRLEDARSLLLESLSMPDLPPQYRTTDLLTLALVNLQLGEDASEPLAQAQALTGASARPSRCGNLLLVRSRTLGGEPSLAAAQEALDLARENGLEGLQIAAHTGCAHASLALGLVDEAATHTSQALAASREFTAPDFYYGELLLLHYRALAAKGDHGADAALRQAADWVERAAATFGALDARTTFVERNPVNREILGIAAGRRNTGVLRQ